MKSVAQTRIDVCGRLRVELEGDAVEARLPGRQGRLLVAFLALNRHRPTGRGELMDLLWPEQPPQDPDEALSAVLSRVRHAVGAERLEGRAELTLRLPAGAVVDLETAQRDLERAEEATDRGEWDAAGRAAQAAFDVARRGFFARQDNPWVSERRREVEDLRLGALEHLAASALGLGEPAGAERAARSLVEAAPFRESGHRLLMEALAARGNVAEALQVYDRLRVRLRDELGTVPGAAVLELHERLLAGAPPPPAADPLPASEERKIVSVLVAGIAETAPAADPEHRRAALAPVQARLTAELERYGGTVERVAGAVVIATFGAPLAHGDDAQRAVAAALRVQSLVPARVGVATGEAIVGGPGAEAGELVAQALRLEQAAPAGAVIADDPTRRATRAAVAYEPIDGEAPAWRATALRPDGAPEPTPLIGRGSELDLLERLFGSVVAERRPRLITVVGDAGVGKSRLADELVARTQGGRDPPAVLRGRCLAYGEGITYWALREVAWDAAGIRLGDTSAAAAAKLARLLARLPDGPGERGLHALAIGAGLSLDANPLEAASPAAIDEELGLVWPQLLSALADERPAIVVMEDLHWAEPPLLDMLDRIAARASGPLLLLATARPELLESRPGWGGAAGTSLALEPLAGADARELADVLLPGTGHALRAAVAAKAEGNPFFAEEIAEHLADRDALGRDELTGLSLPGTVRAVIAARIDTLPEPEKSVLQDAAVIGRSFWVATLEATRAHAALRASLRSLEDKRLVVTKPASLLPDQTELQFRHALIRDVAYASIPRARRARAHAGVAGWVEERAGDRRREFVDLLAHHLEAAASPADAALAWPGDEPERDRVRARAVAALLDAGRAAKQRFQTGQAARYASRALRLAGDDAERLAALWLKAESLHAAVRADEAFATYLEAFALARAMGDRGAAARLRAEAVLLCARYAGAFSGDAWEADANALVEQGLEEEGEDAITFETGALLIGRLRRPRWHGAPSPSARRDALRAEAIAEAIGSPYLLSAALHARYKVVIERGLCECAEVGERLVRASGRMIDRYEDHEGLVVAATSFFWAGRFDAALEVAERAVATAAALSPHRRLHAYCVHSACLGAAGRMPELAEATAEVPDLVRGDRGPLCPYGALALARHAQARFEAGEREAAESTVALLDDSAPTRRAAAFLYRGVEILRPFTGLERARAAMQLVDGVPLDAADRTSRLRLDLQLCALDGDDRLAEAVRTAREWSAPTCAPYLAWIADWATAVHVARGGDAERALACALPALDAFAAYGEPYVADRLLVDLLPLLSADARREAAEVVAARLERTGALASAAQARQAA